MWEVVKALLFVEYGIPAIAIVAVLVIGIVVTILQYLGYGSMALGANIVEKLGDAWFRLKWRFVRPTHWADAEKWDKERAERK